MAELEACRITDQAVVVGLYPDVCLTPPNSTPVPYAVIARFNDGVRARATVRFGGLDAMTDFGRISRVYGDEAGVGGGITSGVNMGMCRSQTASTSVRINGQHIVRHTDTIEMNCAGPEGPSNTLGKVMYVPVGTPLPVGPMGEVAGDTDPPVEPETPEEISRWGQVKGFFKGMKDGAVDTVVGVKDLGVGAFWMSDVGQLVNPARSNQARDTFKTTVGAIWDDPGLVWDGIKEPYVEAWGRGAYGEAIGRGTLEAVLAVVGTKGVDKAAKGATAASRVAGAADDVARLTDDVARLADDAGRLADDAARAGSDAARAAASGADDAARAGSDGLQVLGKPKRTPQPYDVGPYDELRGTLPGYDAHHVGQAAPMERMVPGYNRAKAPTILVDRVGHTRRGPRGIVSRSTKDVTTPRGLLARDLRELRRVYPDVPNSQLRKLIDMNKRMYPGSFTK